MREVAIGTSNSPVGLGENRCAVNAIGITTSSSIISVSSVGSTSTSCGDGDRNRLQRLDRFVAHNRLHLKAIVQNTISHP